jgi:serine/threonine protein kinase
MASAAEQLVGEKLIDGWTVVSKLPARPGATGGTFSVGYLVRNADGREGFLKALDFSHAFAAGADPARVLQAITTLFNFERDVLAQCRTHKLSRVATAIADGSLKVKGFAIDEVPYLIFELADGDARAHLDRSVKPKLAWRLRTLQHVAIGLRQLHSKGIAHQDVKPSNVLDYQKDGSRVADLGRAAVTAQVGPFDAENIAGDKGYAAPELLYGHVDPDWKRRRFGADVYLLGSLIFFFFSKASATGAIISKLAPGLQPSSWTGTFTDVLPSIRSSFTEVLDEFGTTLTNIPELDPKSRHRLLGMVRELCEPDPILRGHPSALRYKPQQYDLEKYVSELNLLATAAEIKGT